MLTSKRLAENGIQTHVVTSKTDVMMSKWRPDIMHKSRLTPSHVRRHFLSPVRFTEIPVGYARIYVSYVSYRYLQNIVFLQHLINGTFKFSTLAFTEKAVLVSVVNDTSWKKIFCVLKFQLAGLLIWATSWEDLSYAYNKDADLPVLPCSLISDFALWCLLPKLCLISVCMW